jgi:hypothetical protein
MDIGCGCLGMAVILAVLLIIAGLMDTFAKGRPDIGLPIIGVGLGIIAVAYFILGRSADRDLKRRMDYGGSSKPQFDSEGRFYCNACGGYVHRHDPSNHPECN